MSTITHSTVEHLVQQLPEDKLPDAYRYLSELATNGNRAPSPTDFVHLPLSERRRLMAEHSRQMVAHYEQTADDREDWQGGDFRDE
jgi:hypothetical protein